MAGAPRLEPISQQLAFTRVLAFAHCFDPENREEASRLVRDYAELVVRVPLFSLHYRPGLDGLAEVLDVLEASMRQPAGASR